MITINIVGRSARVVDKDIITTGSVGAQVGFTFDDEWDGLVKVATFRCGSLHYDQTIINGKCVIPHEVLANVGETLEIGVYGSSVANTTVTVRIPTVWCVYGKVKEGAAISNATSTAATPNAVEQMLSYASSCADDASDALTSASNAEGYADQAARSALAAAAAAAGKQDALTAEGYVAIGSDNSIDLSSGTQDWIRSTGMSVSQLEAAVQFINRELLPGKQDKLTAGNAITISGDTIGVTAGVFGSAADVQDAYDRAVYASNVGVTQAARLTTLIDNKEDKLVAGSGITLVTTQTGTSEQGVPIKRTTISATGGGGGGSYDDTELRNRIGVIEGKESGWDGKQDVISDLDTIRNGAAAGATAVQPESGKGLFSGSYPDLTNKPTLAVELDIERNPDNLTVGYLRNTGTVNTNAPTNRMIVVDVSQLPSVGFSGVTTSTSVYDYYGFSTAETIEAAIADASTVTAVDISQNNAAAIPVPSTAKLFILSVNTADLAAVKVFKNLPIGTDGINAMIDAKIGTLETLSASVLELIGDEVSG